MAFAAQWHTPHNRCVRFAPAVAGDHATLATGRPLRPTRTGLSPAGPRQLSWRTSNPWPQQRKHGLLRCARNDEESAHDFVLAAPCARAVDESSAQRGRGERRMPVAPAASCALVVVERTRVTTSTPESPDVPARNGFNGFLRALPGDRAVLPPSLSGYVFVYARSGRLKLRELDASIGASGPH